MAGWAGFGPTVEGLSAAQRAVLNMLAATGGALSVSGNLDMGGNRIKSLPLSESAGDAARADELIQAATTATWWWDKPVADAPVEVDAIAPTVASDGLASKMVAEFTNPAVAQRGLVYARPFAVLAEHSVVKLAGKCRPDVPGTSETVELSLCVREWLDDGLGWSAAVALGTFTVDPAAGDEWLDFDVSVAIGAGAGQLDLAAGEDYQVCLVHTGGTEADNFELAGLRLRAV